MYEFKQNVMTHVLKEELHLGYGRIVGMRWKELKPVKLENVDERMRFREDVRARETETVRGQSRWWDRVTAIIIIREP